MEEAAFMSEKMFATVIVPLLGVNKTAVLAISTPDDEYNYYTNLINVEREPGRKLFKVIKIGMACDPCEAAGIVCTHKILRYPFWKSGARQDMIDLILKNMPELNARENAGQIISTKQFMVEPRHLKIFHDKPSFKITANVPVIHTGIDPSGGGSASDYSMVSMAYIDNIKVLLGAEASNSWKHNEVLKMMDNHIRALRTVSYYKDALIIVYIEANMSFISASWVAEHLQNPVNGLGRVWVVGFDPQNKGRIGVWTGEKEKEAYFNLTQADFSNGKFHYADHFITTTSSGKNSKRHYTELISQTKMILEDQIKNYRKETEPPKDAFSKPKITYTGKSSGVRDDLSMSLQIVNYYSEKLRTRSDFIRMCIHHGLSY